MKVLEKDETQGPAFDRPPTVIGLQAVSGMFDETRKFGVQLDPVGDLRARGCKKTAELLLRLQVVFKGKEVFWIEPKAQLGDFSFMQKDYRAFTSYGGKYGPGLVIYCMVRWCTAVTP